MKPQSLRRSPTGTLHQVFGFQGRSRHHLRLQSRLAAVGATARRRGYHDQPGLSWPRGRSTVRRAGMELIAPTSVGETASQSPCSEPRTGSGSRVYSRASETLALVAGRAQLSRIVSRRRSRMRVLLRGRRLPRLPWWRREGTPQHARRPNGCFSSRRSVPPYRRTAPPLPQQNRNLAGCFLEQRVSLQRQNLSEPVRNS